MGELRVISAGAGTGKTHRLAQELVDALVGVDGAEATPPEGVVAVTYTRSAAAELERRVRTALIERGHPDLARRLAAARIGTVHSVCARLVDEHAFSLGLAPELSTLDDSSARAVFEEALAAAITDDERRALDELEQRVNLGDDGAIFYGHVRAIAERARANDLDDDDLVRSCHESTTSLLANLPPPRPGDEIERALLAAIDETLPPYAGKRWSQKITDELDRTRRAGEQLRRGEALRWSEWLALEQSESLKAVGKAAALHVEHDQLGKDLVALCTLAFAVARRAIVRYVDDKRSAGVIDFGDQEHLALAVVETPGMAEVLAADIQLLLVDEFQDTSPLQLRLFAALKDIARRTVVVGDEKQSIFGFRDADPTMFSSFAQTATDVARLGVSYRSRPGLVRAVSAVFSQAFAATMQPGEVGLAPVGVDDPRELGPHVERWWQETANEEGRVDEEAVVGAGVAELLNGAREAQRENFVRSSGGIKPAVARDIAVLCPTNAACRTMAAALAARGVPVLLRQRGLAKTFEARVVAAALALWLDAGDLLARATLVSLLDAAHIGDDGASVLAAFATAERGAALADHPLVVTVVAAAEHDRHAGLVRAVDRVVDMLRLDDHVSRLDDPAQRRADLAAVRALAVRFVDESFARGRGPTIAGFLARLEALQGARADDVDALDDERGDIAGKDAVEVLTWHKAKGREWPIVVLAGSLWRDPTVRPFDVAVEREKDPAAPLSAPPRPSWLRLWPSPYGGGSGDTNDRRGLFKAVRRAPMIERLVAANLEEQRRLVYVGFTRPRDRLVVVGDHMIWSKGAFSPLTVGPERRPLCVDPPGKEGLARWAGVDVQMKVHEPRSAARVSGVRSELVLPPLPPPILVVPDEQRRAPKYLQPSAAVGTAAMGERVELGLPKLPAFVGDDFESLNHLGQCLHAYLAWDAFVDVTDTSKRLQRAALMRQRFEITDDFEISASDIVRFGTQLWAALDVRFPGHTRHTEVPMQHRLPTGSVVRGQLDLLLKLPDGSAVVVDHKTVRKADVSGYAGQLTAYAHGVVASGTPMVTTWIHLPLLGALVAVELT